MFELTLCLFSLHSSSFVAIAVDSSSQADRAQFTRPSHSSWIVRARSPSSSPTLRSLCLLLETVARYLPFGRPQNRAELSQGK